MPPSMRTLAIVLSLDMSVSSYPAFRDNTIQLSSIPGQFTCGSRNMVERPRTIDAVAKKITSMSDASQKIWGRKKAEPKDIKAALLILIAAGILEYTCLYEPERQLELSLKVSKDGAPKFAYDDNEAWLQIPSWYIRM